jgi:hypothetical protein
MISRFEAIIAMLLLVRAVFGPRNTPKDAKNFSSKIEGYLSITFLVDFLSCNFVCFVR